MFCKHFHNIRKYFEADPGHEVRPKKPGPKKIFQTYFQKAEEWDSPNRSNFDERTTQKHTQSCVMTQHVVKHYPH